MNYKQTTKRDWNVRRFGQRVGAVTVFLLFLADAGGAERAYVTDRQGQRPQPIVAIDNVCAWPNLTVLRDGTIVATIFNQPSHGTTAGDVECWASVGGGRTWHKRGTPAEHENEHSNRMNVADFQGDGGYPSSVQLPDGQVLTAFYGQPYHTGVVVWEPPAIVIPHDASGDVHEEAERTDETIRPEVVVTMGARELVRPRDAMPFVMDSTLATLRRDAKTWFFYHSTDWGKDNEKFLGTPSDPFQTKVWRKGRDELYDLNGWYADVHHAGLWLNNIYQLDDGHLLGVVHVELHYQAPRVYQGEDYAIGVVYSTDGGDRWTYCGEIVRPQNSKLNVGGTPLLVVGDHFHVYFNDHGPGGRKLAVARARISDVRAAARQHTVTTWRKYRDGSWNEDGLTGLGSAVLPDCEIGGGHPADLHADAAYNRAVGLHMITRWSYAQGVGRLYLHLSPDGIHFDRQYLVDEEPGQWMPYSTFIADEQDQETNDMSSVGGEFSILINHKNATNYGADALHRRRISISRK